jgi:protein-S-isoprenylcysteine O-methyltransferase Ste14
MTNPADNPGRARNATPPRVTTSVTSPTPSPTTPTGWARIARRIRVPLGFLFAIVYFYLARPTWTSIAAGLVLAAPGVLIRALASGHIHKNEQLTTTGPYAYTRNPLYLGSFIIALGFAIASRSLWVAAAMVVLFLAIYLPVIRSEEAYLRHRFSKFEDYSRNVPRILPRLRAYHPRGAFSWELYLKHREYNATLGTLAMMAALTVKLLVTKS